LEHLGELSAGLFVREVFETCIGPRIGITFDDEGAGRLIESVRVRSENPGRGLPKSQRQPMEQLSGAVPDVFVGTGAEIRLEVGTEGLPDNAVQSVRAHQQLAIAFERFHAVDFMPKLDLNAEVFTSLLQDLE